MTTADGTGILTDGFTLRLGRPGRAYTPASVPAADGTEVTIIGT